LARIESFHDAQRLLRSQNPWHGADSINDTSLNLPRAFYRWQRDGASIRLELRWCAVIGAQEGRHCPITIRIFYL